MDACFKDNFSFPHVWISLENCCHCSLACSSISIKEKNQVFEPAIGQWFSIYYQSQAKFVVASIQEPLLLHPWNETREGKQACRLVISQPVLAGSPVSLISCLGGFFCGNSPHKGGSHRLQSWIPISGISGNWSEMGRTNRTGGPHCLETRVFQRCAQRRPAHGYFGKKRKV